MQRSAEVSVVIPTHNRSALVVRAVKSVLSQTYSDLECIVVDDASSDDTAERLRQIADDRLVCVHHESPRGASAARNTGIQLAKGRYVAFLDDDDEWLPHKLDRQLSVLKNAPDNVGLVYCWMDYQDEGGFQKSLRPSLRGYIFADVLDTQPIGNSSTLLVRRNVIADVGPFDESLPRGNDGDFIRRICQKYDVDFVPEVLVRIDVGHGYERITGVSEAHIRKEILSQEIKLRKFASVLSEYPKQRANIHALIGYDYAQLQERKAAFSNFFQAMRLYPFSLQLWKKFAKGMVELAGRGPLRRF